MNQEYCSFEGHRSIRLAFEIIPSINRIIHYCRCFEFFVFYHRKILKDRRVIQISIQQRVILGYVTYQDVNFRINDDQPRLVNFI